MNIGNNVKELRKVRKLTQKQLGELINKGERTVQKYEKGDILPPIDVLLKISDVLKFPYLDLIKDTEYDNLKGKETVDIPLNSSTGIRLSLKDAMINQVGEAKELSEEILMLLEKPTDKEKEIILNLVKYYNGEIYNYKYDLSKFDDDHIQELKIILHSIIKAILKDCIK